VISDRDICAHPEDTSEFAFCAEGQESCKGQSASLAEASDDDLGWGDVLLGDLLVDNLLDPSRRS